MSKKLGQPNFFLVLSVPNHLNDFLKLRQSNYKLISSSNLFSIIVDILSTTVFDISTASASASTGVLGVVAVVVDIPSFACDSSGDLLDADFAALVGGILTDSCLKFLSLKVVQNVSIIKQDMLSGGGSSVLTIPRRQSPDRGRETRGEMLPPGPKFVLLRG